MSTNVIAFDSLKSLPAHFAGATGAMSLNDAAEEFASIKFAVISTKGGRFHVKRDGEKELILRPKSHAGDPDEPATYIDVTILNLQKSKTYYDEGYTEGSEAKPTCFSNDGIKPDSSAAEPQCSTCALCHHNAWGSGTNDKGDTTKGKACSDAQRLAVATPDNMDDPMMFRVPPASLKNLAEMSKTLSKKNIPLNGVVTRISFDTDATGVITFKPTGFLDEATFAKAQAKMNDDLVLAIVGKKNRAADALGSAPAHISKATPAVDPAIAKKESEKKLKAVAKAAKIAAAKAALEAASSDDDDDEDAPAPVAEKPAKKTKSAVTTSSGIDAELARLLA